MQGETVLMVRWNRRINSRRRFEINARFEDKQISEFYSMNFFVNYSLSVISVPQTVPLRQTHQKILPWASRATNLNLSLRRPRWDVQR